MKQMFAYCNREKGRFTNAQKGLGELHIPDCFSRFLNDFQNRRKFSILWVIFFNVNLFTPVRKVVSYGKFFQERCCNFVNFK